MKIGFVGLGIMGKPMAMHLKDAGHELHVPERKSLAADVRAAATVHPDPRAVAEAAEAVVRRTWKRRCSRRAGWRKAFRRASSSST